MTVCLDLEHKLGEIDVFADLGPLELASIIKVSTTVYLGSGTTLFRRGELSDAMYLLLSGAVELRLDGDPIDTLEEGADLGSWALLDAAPRVVSAVATTPVTLLRIGRSAFEQVLAEHTAVKLGVLSALARRVRALAALIDPSGLELVAG